MFFVGIVKWVSVGSIATHTDVLKVMEVSNVGEAEQEHYTEDQYGDVDNSQHGNR